MRIFKEGDKVKYSRDFLRSTGQITGDVPFAKGVVMDVAPMGDRQLVTIDFDLIGRMRVLNSNLVMVGQMEVER